MMMSHDDWQRAAEHFGLSPEAGEAHRQAWEDLARLHPGPFCVETVGELFAALTAMHERHEPLEEATWRRLSARSLIITEMAAWARQEIEDAFLRDFKGPAQ